MSDSKRLASHPRPQKTTKGLSHLHSRTKTDGLTRDALRFSSWEPTPRKDYWESQWDLALAHMPMKLRPSLNNRGEIWSSLEKKRGRERREGDLLFYRNTPCFSRSSFFPILYSQFLFYNFNFVRTLEKYWLSLFDTWARIRSQNVLNHFSLYFKDSRHQKIYLD